MFHSPSIFALLSIAFITCSKSIIASPLTARDGAGPLYGPSGQPNCADIVLHQPDCWLVSALCALVKGNPAWITSKISFAGDVNSLSAATVKVFSPNDRTPHEETVTFDQAAARNDKRGPQWWVGLMQNAALQMGLACTAYGVPTPMGQTATGEFTGSFASEALMVFTGLPAVDEFVPAGMQPHPLTKDDVWNIATKADFTPVVLGTTNTATTLTFGHAYAVMTTSSPNGVRTMTLFNPNDGVQVNDYALDDIFNDIQGMSHLTNWDAWVG